MPSPTVALDSVQDTAADIDVTGTTGTIARGGWVDDLEGDPTTFLGQCFAAVNAREQPGTFFPGTSLPYRRLQVRPTGGSSAAIVLYYTAQAGGAVSAYVISTRSYMSTIQTKNILSTGDPIVLEWAQDPSSTTSYKVKVSPVVTAQFPIREVTVNGVTLGTSPDFERFEGKVGYVNAELWRSRNPGFWMIADGGVDASPYSGTYGWHLSALSRNIIDWSDSQDLVDPRSGQRVTVSNADAATVTSAPYKQGIIAKVNGRTRWGQYPLTSFTALFGFGGTGGNQIPRDNSGVRSNT